MNRTNDHLSPDGMYFISCKEDDYHPIFEERDDYINFLNNYNKALRPIADTFAYCLTATSIQLLVRFKDAKSLMKKHNPSKKLSSKEISAHNLETLKRVLPSKAIKLLSVKEVTKTEYHKNVVHLIHAVPVSNGFIRTMSRWEFSSYRAYVTGKTDTINREEGLNWFGGAEAFLKFHRTHKTSNFSI